MPFSSTTRQRPFDGLIYHIGKELRIMQPAETRSHQGREARISGLRHVYLERGMSLINAANFAPSTVERFSCGLRMEPDHCIRPSYFGFVETSNDARSLIQACLQGALCLVRRRPTSSERSSVAQSGHIFIYEEKASGIQRWTDGRHWSPSRILGEFLIYGERKTLPGPSHITNTVNEPLLAEGGAEWRQRLDAPLARSFDSPPEGLVKKTISIRDAGTIWHLVSYYRPIDVLQGRLPTPSMNQILVPRSWPFQNGSIPCRIPPEGCNARDSGMFSPFRHLDSPQFAESHTQQTWLMRPESALDHHAEHNQGLVPDFGVSNNGNIPWSYDDQLDPSLLRYAYRMLGGVSASPRSGSF